MSEHNKGGRKGPKKFYSNKKKSGKGPDRKFDRDDKPQSGKPGKFKRDDKPKSGKPGSFKRDEKPKRGGQPKPFRKKGGRPGGKSKGDQPSTFKRHPKPKEQQEGMRLNKYLAHSGVAARRKADELIAQGLVKVNKKVVTEMGHRVMPGDEVTYKGQPIKPVGEFVYILLNKPKDTLTTTDDDRGRRTVMRYIRDATNTRVYPVGRLDRDTTGLLLLTNDGELAQKLAHPSFRIKKVYKATLNKPLTEKDMERIAEGLELEDGRAVVDVIAYANDDRTEIGLELHIGKNRIVRRIFEHLGYEVVKLDRMTYAGLTKKGLARSKWRYLTEKEVRRLRHFT